MGADCVPSVRRYSLPALARLIDRFSPTLSELRLPISAEVVAAIANCHRLQELTIEDICLLRQTDGQNTEAVLMLLFTRKRELKVLNIEPLPNHLPGLSQALLSTSSQLETLSFQNVAFLNEYWSLVR